jgi:hypothetical protein
VEKSKFLTLLGLEILLLGAKLVTSSYPGSWAV